MVLSPFCIQWWCLTHIPLRGGDSNQWRTLVCSAHSTLHSTSGPKLFGCKATRKFPLQSSPKENIVSPLNSCNSPVFRGVRWAAIARSHYQGDLSNFFGLTFRARAAISLALAFSSTKDSLVWTKSSRTLNCKSSQPASILRLSSKPVKSSFVNWSASTFSSLGLHLNPKLSLDLDREDDNCILIPINGHFVVERFSVSDSFARLSVPPKRETSISLLSFCSFSQPNKWRAVSDANNSAEVDAHCDPLSGLKR